MTRDSKSRGKYNISGSRFSMLCGTRAQVWHGTAYKTSGGLKKNNLMKNKSGRIVSKSKHSSAKRENRLVKSGYGTKKGQFGYVKMGTKSTKSKKGSRGKKGGSPYGNNFSPAGVSASGIAGQGITNFGRGSNNVQMEAGMSGGKSRKRRGGYGNNFSPAGVSASGIDGQGITNYGNGSNNVQFEAGMSGGKSRKRRGGYGYGRGFSFLNNGNNLQFQAGNAS